MKIRARALTFEDVLLVPAYSEILPKEVSLTTRLSRNITLNAPLVSAAMDTVTEERTAIAMARLGGIGVVHKNMDQNSQVAVIKKVKKSESGVIIDPIFISPNASLRDAKNITDNYKISGVPVVDEHGNLIGILTNRDMRFECDLSRAVGEVMTKAPLITAQVGTSLEEARQIMNRHKIEKLPLVDGNGKLKGLITIKDIQKRIEYPNANKDEIGRLRVAAAIGVFQYERAKALVDAGVDALVLDSAHGHSRGIIETVREIKKVYTVVSGDSIKRIANTFEISTEELYSMNTWLKETTVIYPGDKIIVANEVPFMQVKMTCTATFEEKTSIPVEYVESKSYYVGVTKVKSNGSAGTDMVTAEISYINGVEVDRIVLSRDSVKKAVPKVVYKGTKSGYTLPTLKGSYIRPVDDGRISSPYGYRTHPVTGEKESFHTGLDIATKKDTPIHAAASGTIIFMAKSGNYGNLVKIDHGNGYVTYYAHCNSFASGLKVGSKVTVGDTIAYVGMTGRATGYHVHFEIRYKNQTVNINKLFPN